MADPTLLMTKRGQDWTRRASASSGSQIVSCSGTYIAAASQSGGANIPIYYRRLGVRDWRTGDHLAADVAAFLLPIYGYGRSASQLQLSHLERESAEIIMDIWHGISIGHWLVARRASTFTALVRAGVTVVVRGPDSYRDVFAMATGNLSNHLTEALDRRVRYIAGPLCEKEQNDGPGLFLYDGGLDSFR